MALSLSLPPISTNKYLSTYYLSGTMTDFEDIRGNKAGKILDLLHRMFSRKKQASYDIKYFHIVISTMKKIIMEMTGLEKEFRSGDT